MQLRKHSRPAAMAGFSLIELMVVIVILALLATQVVPKLMDKFAVANEKIAITEITTIVSAVTDYAIQNNGRYPDSLDELVTPDENGRRYLDTDNVPTDPWGNPYEYEPPSGGQDFQVITRGKDGLPGGDGDSRDIDNIMIKNKEV